MKVVREVMIVLESDSLILLLMMASYFSCFRRLRFSRTRSNTTIVSLSEYPTIEFGAHFHTNPDKWKEKVDTAYQNGCSRFDSALKGYGGCPMAKDDLVGNMPTEKLITYFSEDLGLNMEEFEKSLALSQQIF